MFTKLTAPILMALVLTVGCAPYQGGGETGTGFSTSGVITGFGSVFVNGVEYHTTSATKYSVDGASGKESQLAVGMYVTLEGSVDASGTEGRASAIRFADDVEGIVLSIDSANSSLNVMGQTVIHSVNTRFDDGITTAGDIVVDNIVEVSGYSDGLGTIYATRIALKDNSYQAGEDIEVKGLVQQLDTNARTFKLGGLTVNYTGAELKDFEKRTFANDVYVEAKAKERPVLISGNYTLNVIEVELENNGSKEIEGDEGEEHEIEGIVTTKLSETKFKLNGITVVHNAQTEFEHGTASGIVEGVRLKVDGHYNANNELLAEKIKFRDTLQSDRFNDRK